MPLFKGFRFSFNLSSNNDIQPDLYENVAPVYVTGAYKLTGEQFYGSGSYEEAPKKITPSMVKLPPSFQPDPTDPDVIRNSKNHGNLTNIETKNLPPNLKKSTPEVSTNPQGAPTDKRHSTDLRNTNKIDSKSNEKEQKKLEKKRLADQKKQEKLEVQQKAKEEKLRKEREKAELKENAKSEKLRVQKEKAEAAKTKKNKAEKGKPKNEKKVPVKTRTNPLAQGPNAPLPYTTNTLESSISKATGPPPYDDDDPSEVRNPVAVHKEVVKNENDNTGNTSFGAPIDSGSTWDMVAQHKIQVSRKHIGAAGNKVSIKLQVDPTESAVTGRKS